MTDRIVFTTQLKHQQDIDNTMIMRSVRERLSHTNISVESCTGNVRGLPTVYNEFLTKHRNDTRWMVFVHDDVYIDDAHVVDKLEHVYHQHGFEIVGLAGCLHPSIKSHNLWHVMADRNNLFGHVAHPSNESYNGQPTIRVTSFGPSPHRVTLIDGLFIAVHVPTVEYTGWKFNENYTFHHYDLSSCIDANNKRLKIGVAPINVIHTSPGLMSLEDVAWSSSNQRFLKEYGSNSK